MTPELEKLMQDPAAFAEYLERVPEDPALLSEWVWLSLGIPNIDQSRRMGEAVEHAIWSEASLDGDGLEG